MKYKLKIRKIRESKNISEGELARRSNLTQSYLSKLELNKVKSIRGIRLATLKKIANSLDINMRDLIDE